jgi:GAF domain-containing protein
MAASSEKARLLELFQLQNEEGPCLEAFATGHAVVHGDLAAATEYWPKFAPEAVSAGFRSVAALPLRLGQRNIGAFNLFRAQAGELDPADVLLAQTLADVASITSCRIRRSGIPKPRWISCSTPVASS